MEELELDFDLDLGGIDNFEIADDLEITLEEEKPTEEITTQTDQEEIPIDNQPQTTIFYNLVSEKIRLGEWEDLKVNVDGEERQLSEFKDIDEETYNILRNEQKEFEKKEINENYTSVKGLTETQKNLIDIIKSGDYETAKNLFQEPNNLKEPFESYDPSKEQHHVLVLQALYKNKGMNENEIRSLIATAKETGELESKALEVVESAREQFRKNVAQKKIELEEENKLIEANKKTYAKEVEDALKKKGIESSAVAKKMASAAIKQTDTGELEIDTLYEAEMKNPETAADLIFYLTQKEEFLKWVNSNTKKETHREVLKTVNIVREKARATKTEVAEENTSIDFEL